MYLSSQIKAYSRNGAVFSNTLVYFIISIGEEKH